jgi:hypothetical protein
MKWTLQFVIAALAASAIVTASAQTVTADRGNIYFAPGSSAARTQLTRTGLDTQPSLSPDGKLVVFVRSTPGDTVVSAMGDAEVTELRTIQINGSGERLRLRGRGGEPPLAGFQKPLFAPDGSRIYFEGVAGVASTAIYELNLSTNQTRLVCLGAIKDVVRRGAYAGHLIVFQHRYFVGGGSYDWAWMIAPDGHEVGPIGDPSDADFEQRLGHALGTQHQ